MDIKTLKEMIAKYSDDQEIFINLPGYQEFDFVDTLLDISGIEYDEKNDRLIMEAIL